MSNENQYLIWKHVPGYVNIQVNQYGQVRDSGTHELKPFHMCGDYLSVSAKKVQAIRFNTTYVHTLVMAAFKGERPVGYHIDHKDGDPLNNTLANLHYVTVSQNARNRKNQIMVIYNGKGTVMIEALEDMFGKNCVSASTNQYGYKLYARIKTMMVRGLTFDQAIQYEIKKRGWPVPASNE